EAVEADLFLEAAMEVLDDLLASALVGGARDEAHLPHRLDEVVGVPPEHALEKLGDPLAHAGAELRHGAEVEEDDLAAGLDQQVPGVRIGVVDAVDEAHLAVEA